MITQLRVTPQTQESTRMDALQTAKCAGCGGRALYTVYDTFPGENNIEGGPIYCDKCKTDKEKGGHVK